MKELKWWQSGVVYQVLVRSFMDLNGDGDGDLRGLISKLDYLRWLGVRAIWLSPIYPSPWVDLGYDVTDYRAVHPMFGDLDEFDRLLQEAHARDLKVILDAVPNHTSDRHPWFEASRSSRESDKRDWYIWADRGKDGGPPNNWLSVFGDSAWTFDEGSGQFYFHAFAPEQPDLNWRNPEVAKAVCDAVRFWLDRGIDGLRIDAADMLLEREDFPDNPSNSSYDPSKDAPDRAVLQDHTRDQAGSHDVLALLRGVVDEYEDRVVIGETYLPVEQLIAYYGTPERPEFDLPLNLQLLVMPFFADEVQEHLDRYSAALPAHAWPTISVGNHDGSRIASRAGCEARARAAAMLSLTFPGTPTLYYGDEIGMHDVHIPDDKIHDPQGRRDPARGRDRARSPMQWTPGMNWGFSEVDPWLPTAEDGGSRNVEKQSSDPRSILSLHRRLIELKRENATLRAGRYGPVPRGAPFVAYRIDPEGEGESLLVVLNLSDEPVPFIFEPCAERARLLESTFLDREGEEHVRELELRGCEGVLLALVRPTSL